MARTRSIKPGFFRNERLCELPISTRVLFAGLWTIADREGRLEDRPKRIKVEIFPYDNVNVDEGLEELSQAGFIVRYEVGGGHYIAIPTWKKHQNPHVKEVPSTIPAPDLHSASTGKTGASTGFSGTSRAFHPSTLPPFHPESGTVGEIDSAAQWLADQVCERHHRKGDRGIVERMLVSELAPLADEDQWQWAKTFDDRHKRWCQSDDWTKANRKFVPKLSNWIANGGWRDDPPQSDDDMAFVEKKPSSRGVDPEAPWVAPWET